MANHIRSAKHWVPLIKLSSPLMRTVLFIIVMDSYIELALLKVFLGVRDDLCLFKPMGKWSWLCLKSQVEQPIEADSHLIELQRLPCFGP